MKTGLQTTGKYLAQHLEAFFWLAVLLYFTVSPAEFGDHLSICPLKLSGFQHCPGCGLGRAMILLLHGRISEAISMHPFSIPALVLFTDRIYTVFNNNYRLNKMQITS